MAAVSGLLVPNNYDLFVRSINTTIESGVTADSVTTFTNKTLLDPSNSVAAETLWSGGKTNLVNVGNSSNPTNGQVLTATGVNTATWQAPFSEVTASNTITFTNKTLSDVSNEVTAKRLHYTGGSINVSASAPPSEGKVLKATGVGAASWLDALPGQTTLEVFGTTGAGARQSIGPAITLDKGNGVYFVKAMVTAVDFSTVGGGEPIAYETFASFKLNMGAITQPAAPIANRYGRLITSDPIFNASGTTAIQLSGAADTLILDWKASISYTYVNF